MGGVGGAQDQQVQGGPQQRPTRGSQHRSLHCFLDSSEILRLNVQSSSLHIDIKSLVNFRKVKSSLLCSSHLPISRPDVKTSLHTPVRGKVCRTHNVHTRAIMWSHVLSQTTVGLSTYSTSINREIQTIAFVGLFLASEQKTFIMKLGHKLVAKKKFLDKLENF